MPVKFFVVICCILEARPEYKLSFAKTPLTFVSGSSRPLALKNWIVSLYFLINSFTLVLTLSTSFTTVKVSADEKVCNILKVTPVNSVASIVEDGFTLTEGNENDYVVFKEEGYIVKTGHSRWSDAKYQNVVVTYSGGFATIPDVIRFTCARAAGRILNNTLQLSSLQPKENIDSHKSDTSNDGNFYAVNSESVGDLSLTYGDPIGSTFGPALTAFDITALMPYKRIFFD